MVISPWWWTFFLRKDVTLGICFPVLYYLVFFSVLQAVRCDVLIFTEGFSTAGPMTGKHRGESSFSWQRTTHSSHPSSENAKKYWEWRKLNTILTQNHWLQDCLKTSRSSRINPVHFVGSLLGFTGYHLCHEPFLEAQASNTIQETWW